MLPSFALYTGLVLAPGGLAVIAHPVPRLRLPKRRHGVWITAIALSLAAGAALLPIGEPRTAAPRTRLDAFVPRFQFSEFHRLRVQAPPAEVYGAIRDVTAGEIRFLATLTWIRRFGRPGPEDTLNAPERIPVLDLATSTSFLWLADEPRRELVVGTVVSGPPDWSSVNLTPEKFAALDQPGYAKAAMNFRIEDDGRGGSVERTFCGLDPSRRGMRPPETSCLART